jgi:RNA polymerase sigma-70 factor (ECF subfamily)
MAEETTAILQNLIQRMNAGDPSARDEVLAHACDRLRRLTRKMLHDFPRVKRWAEADDVVQNTLLRLLQALRAVEIHSVAEFFHLAARHIRWGLIDLARHYSGPQAPEAHHASDAGPEGAAGQTPPAVDKPDSTHDAGRLAVWTEFHQVVDQLPPEEREVFDLLWYQELPQAEAAALLNVSVPTVRRRWLAARLRLKAALNRDQFF